MRTQSKKNDLALETDASVVSVSSGGSYTTGIPADKKSFLVFKHNKYIIVATENIAFFYVKYETSIIVCADRQEYPVNYSLEHLQSLLGDKQFFRLNRQYLVNFSSVKEVEHYFARKLLVKLSVTTPEKLLVPKERVSNFLHWLENR